MKRFVVPPTWPSPPRRSWVPPKTWRPDPSWPPAPEDWRFWVDGKGNPVRGPIGLYAGPSRRVMYAGAAALVLFLGVNVWAVTAIGLFGGGSGDPQAVQVVDDRASTPSATPTPTPSPVIPELTMPPPKTTATPTPTQTPTPRPTQQPTKARPTERQTEERSDPTPTKTTTAKKTPKPQRTSRTPTREEILRQYCVQQGWDPQWCDPDNWPEDPADDPRNGP